jgi:hypothetical protein
MKFFKLNSDEDNWEFVNHYKSNKKNKKKIYNVTKSSITLSSSNKKFNNTLSDSKSLPDLDKIKYIPLGHIKHKKISNHALNRLNKKTSDKVIQVSLDDKKFINQGIYQKDNFNLYDYNIYNNYINDKDYINNQLYKNNINIYTPIMLRIFRWMSI